MSPCDQPLISILLPAFNVAQTLLACLKSIQRQTYPHWECLIVDDGSSDETRTIARAFAQGDPRFQVLPGQHEGLVPTLNRGLQFCRGAFIARMDGDDVMRRPRLEIQLEALQARSSLVLVGCQVRLFPREGLSEGRRAYERWLNAIVGPEMVQINRFIECPIAHPTLLARAEVLRSFGYRDQGWPEDYDLLLRLMGAGHAMAVVPQRLLAWRDSPGRLSRTAAAYGQDRFTACKAAFLAEGFLHDTPRYILCGYGSTGRVLVRALEALDKRPAYIAEVHPRRIGNTIRGAEVVPYHRLSSLPSMPILASVAHHGPRLALRQLLTSMGYVEGQHFVCVA